MTPDPSSRNRNGLNGTMSTSTWAAIAVALVVIGVGAMYWSGNRHNTANDNLGAPAQTTGSGGAPAR
jgi:hypothetical protein